MRALHPFTLLTLAAALPAFAWLAPAPAGGLAGVALAGALAAGAGVRRTLLPALAAAAPFWLFLLLLHDPVTTLATGLRITTMVVSVVWVGAVLPPDRLVEAMLAAGWSASVAYLFAATLSAVAVLKARAQRLVDAQRCRGLPLGGGIVTRLRALRALALPLILSALHEVDERALSLETRGLVPGARRTPLAPPPDPALERAGRWALILLCAVLLVVRIA